MITYIKLMRSAISDKWQDVRRTVLDYSRTHRLYRRKRYGRFTYTVVSAVYNVEKYLDAYFATLTQQILDFTTHIQLILVDDGSTDGSAAIIKKWQKRYPHNIRYLYKENGGQGSARNVGIPLVKTPWVTFIDPDDFVDVSYFWHVDTLLQKYCSDSDASASVKILSCNLIYYHEDKETFADRHPLRERFVKKETVISLEKEHNAIQFHVNSVFFSTAELHKKSLLFTEERWATFEDGHFVFRYLLDQKSGQIIFARSPRYYYRKRQDATSSLDTAFLKRERYTDQLRNGVLDIFTYAKKKKKNVPYFVQYAMLYELSWIIKRLFRTSPPPTLTKADLAEFLTLCKAIFSYISPKTILNFPSKLSGFDYSLKVGVLFLFKRETDPVVPVMISRYDHAKDVVSLFYFCAPGLEERLFLDGIEIKPAYAKKTSSLFCGKWFFIRRQLWVHLPKGAGCLTLRLGKKKVVLTLGKTTFTYSVPIDSIRQYFKPPSIPKSSWKHKDAWVFMDRDTHADDNAEHLYRYVRNNYPKQKIYFALRSSSAAWERLREEGFSLLDFGTPKHEAVLAGCSKIISSHVDPYVIEYFKGLSRKKHIVFLQHGVITADLSKWLNSKKIDLFITTTVDEHCSIVDELSPYNITSKEVCLAGLPRYDSLVAESIESEKLIAVMPTWRSSITGERLKQSNERRRNSVFMQTRYATCWQSLLHSPVLERLARDAGYRILFFPHMNVQPYLEDFALGRHIEVMTHAEVNIQNIFKTARILITDYSSVSFDIAIQKKAILYYQFDKDEIYATHLYDKGSFDFERDGFGPVVFDEDSLLKHLEHILRNDGRPDPLYVERMEDTFPFRDGRNCERVYQAICALDAPLPKTKKLDSLYPKNL